MVSKAIEDLRKGLSLYYVWVYQAYHDITAKYKRTVLGSLWMSGGMVVTSVSLAIIFGALFHQSLQQALPYTMSGIVCFMMVGYVFGDGTEMFISAGGIIKNHAYPFTFYAFHTMCKSFINFLHNLVIFWIFMAVIGSLTIPYWSVIPGILVALLFMFSWGMIAGMMAARFRDMRFMLPYMGQLFSMLTPIFWRTDSLHGPVLLAVNLNPVFEIIQLIRDPLLGKPSSAMAWEIALGYTGAGLVLWAIFFTAFRRRIPFWV
jgi:ABC-type polysaccharide/polyol phosphate export permease